MINIYTIHYSNSLDYAMFIPKAVRRTEYSVRRHAALYCRLVVSISIAYLLSITVSSKTRYPLLFISMMSLTLSQSNRGVSFSLFR